MGELHTRWMWYGKLPGLGDFAHRRMPEPLLLQIDQWLQVSLQGVAETYPDTWVEHYLSAPTWRFIWGAGLCREFPDTMLTGIMMPSVDRVGRYFPLLVLCETPCRADSSHVEFSGNDMLLSGLESLMLRALDEDWDAEEMENALSVFRAEAQAGSGTGPLMEIPCGTSAWYRAATDDNGMGMPAMTMTAGLPGNRVFEGLLGFPPRWDSDSLLD